MTADDLMRDRLPETDTPAPPETQAPAGETLLAGKYKTVEELVKAHEEAQRKITEVSEAKARLESLVTSPGYTPPQEYRTYEPPAPPAYTPQVDETGFVTRADVDRYFKERMAEREAQSAAAQREAYWEGRFFQDNADLKNPVAARIAKANGAEVMAGYRHVRPEVREAMMPTILAEIARRTRDDLATVRSESKTETERADREKAAGQVPGGARSSTPPAPPQAPKSIEEQRMEALREDMERHAKTRQPMMYGQR